jgi:hypothetical protein
MTSVLIAAKKNSAIFAFLPGSFVSTVFVGMLNPKDSTNSFLSFVSETPEMFISLNVPFTPVLLVNLNAVHSKIELSGL